MKTNLPEISHKTLQSNRDNQGTDKISKKVAYKLL